MPHHFDEAQGGQAPEDTDQYVGAAPLDNLCFSVKSEIFHVGKEVTSKGLAIILLSLEGCSCLWGFREVDNRRGWRAGWTDVAHVRGRSRDGDADGWMGRRGVDWNT